jgi:hypothetical protein
MPQVPGRPDHAAPKGKLAWANYVEPARIRAVVAAVLALCVALGITLPFDLPGVAEAAIGLLAVVVPLIQGETTRAAVVSPQRADLIAAGRATTGLADGPQV